MHTRQCIQMQRHIGLHIGSQQEIQKERTRAGNIAAKATHRSRKARSVTERGTDCSGVTGNSRPTYVSPGALLSTQAHTTRGVREGEGPGRERGQATLGPEIQRCRQAERSPPTSPCMKQGRGEQTLGRYMQQAEQLPNREQEHQENEPMITHTEEKTK